MSRNEGETALPPWPPLFPSYMAGRMRKVLTIPGKLAWDMGASAK